MVLNKFKFIKIFNEKILLRKLRVIKFNYTTTKKILLYIRLFNICVKDMLTFSYK
jgi:hypothetical protein